MRARWSGALGALLRCELRMLVRDKRMILIAFVAPLVLFPGFIVVMRTVERSEERRLEETVYRYAVTGDRSAWGRELLAQAFAQGEQQDSASTFRFEEADAADPEARLQDGDLHVLVEAYSPAAFARVLEEERAADSTAAPGAGAERSEAGASAAGGAEDRSDEEAVPVPVVRVRYRGQSDFSRTAANRLRARIADVREERRDSVLRAGGFPVDPDDVARVTPRNTASAEREAGAVLGLALTPFLLFLMLSGGSIIAVDAITGEKERGTLETLLTTAASRIEIVTAKQLAIIVVGLAVAVVNIANLLVYVVIGVIELPDMFSVSLSLLDLAVLFVLFVPLAVLVSSSLLLLSGFAQTYKEYQLYFFPLFLAFLVPSLAGMLPGIDLRSAIAFVPISGVGVAVREIMIGQYDWLFIPVAFLSTAAAAVGLARLTERTLSVERLISHSDLDEADLVGGPALFPRHVLRWFGVMWVTLFVVSLWFGDTLGIRGQIAVNLGGIFLGGSLLMVRRYRLDPSEAFALRAPHPASWLAVLVGVPSAYAVGIGLATFVNTYIFPVPQDVLEAFGELFAADEMPLWELLVFVAVAPGILEELAFRGVLVRGLSRKLRPVALCLVVGAVFALFHVSLFRLLPTAFLGTVLAAVVVLTGSIYPAMLWHFLNNALALVPAHQGWIDADTAVPDWALPAGLAGLALAFAILWWTRRPYPGLRKRRPPQPGAAARAHPGASSPPTGTAPR